MSDQILVSGEPVPADRSHTELKANGQQRDYVVLTQEERAKGFVKPLRHSYVHLTCGGATHMGGAIAETYARDPRFYSGTFCVHCRKHFPLKEFTWDGGGELNGEPMDPDLQNEWLVNIREQRKREAEERRQRRIAELKRELAEGVHAGSHHGAPDLHERDVKLLRDCMLWIQTARKSGRFGYGEGWLPGHVDFLKSRLFWRIRSGKSPLPEAPPCAYSCPWYELIEEDRPHSVWEDVRVYTEFAGSKYDPPKAAVAQTFYDVLEQREDGSLLLGYGPYRFKAWAGKIPATQFVDGEAKQIEIDGWWIQRVQS